MALNTEQKKRQLVVNFINLERRTSVQLCKMIVENRVGVLADKEMEEAARRDFQEEPGMMERCLQFV